MPDYIVTPSPNTLPVWDSFEAFFFVLAGVIIGFVSAHLIPSIWRTIRRRFRSHDHYIIHDIAWNRTLEINLDILPLEKKISAIQGEKDIQRNFSLIELFIIARDLVQKGELRQAVKIYGEILTSDKVSTTYLHRALFELAQVYFLLGLYPRAFDTGLELLKRRRRDEQILDFLLKVLSVHTNEGKLLTAYRLFKGKGTKIVHRKLAFLACQYAQNRLKQNLNDKKTLGLIRFALEVEQSFKYALFLLWQFNHKSIQYKKNLDIRAKWVAFAANLESWVYLCEDAKLSPHALTYDIASLILELITHDSEFKDFDLIQVEFREILNFKNFSTLQQKILLDSIFSAIILLRDAHTQITEQNCLLFLKKICNDEHILQYVMVFSANITQTVLKLGSSAHFCSNCQAIFAHFDWSCNVCHLPEALTPYTSLFKEYDSNANINNGNTDEQKYQKNENICKNTKNRHSYSHDCN